ncbi:DUF4197 domain-containing protein, partial [Aliarcobacter butzleri]|nr:DUF4197 domain-containing protein [Aliarcobacter butzleri]
MKKSIIVSALVIGTTFSFALDLGSIAKGVMENISDNKTTTSNTTSTVNSSLDNATISNGLKEALKNGVSFATTELGKSDGYLNNKSVKIPLPDNIKTIESVIRK